MRFFWRQPAYQSDLDNFFHQLAMENPTLPAAKEAGLKQLWDKEPFDMEVYARHQASLLPQPANPYR